MLLMQMLTSVIQITAAVINSVSTISAVSDAVVTRATSWLLTEERAPVSYMLAMSCTGRKSG